MSREAEAKGVSGWVMLVVELALVGLLVLLIRSLAMQEPTASKIAAVVVLGVLAALVPGGFMVVEPNGSKVLLLFGSYQGTAKKSGFQWVSSFNTKRALSLRVRTLNGEQLKVNDLAGDPVEIAAIVV